MRVFVAGASGALGSHLVPQLIDAGHEVIGTHNSPASAQLVEVLGAEPVRLDLLDPRAVRTAVLGSRPDAIVHEATALGGVKFGRNLHKATATTSGCVPRERTRCWPPRRRRASAGSWRRASRPSCMHGRAD